MNHRKLTTSLFCITVMITSAVPALAAQTSDSINGHPAPVERAERTIVLNKNYVNVQQGETVKFVTPQGVAFAWNFDTWSTRAFPLSAIAPGNVNVDKVKVYVSSNSIYSGSR